MRDKTHKKLSKGITLKQEQELNNRADKLATATRIILKWNERYTNLIYTQQSK